MDLFEEYKKQGMADNQLNELEQEGFAIFLLKDKEIKISDSVKDKNIYFYKIYKYKGDIALAKEEDKLDEGTLTNIETARLAINEILEISENITIEE